MSLIKILFFQVNSSNFPNNLKASLLGYSCFDYLLVYPWSVEVIKEGVRDRKSYPRLSYHHDKERWMSGHCLCHSCSPTVEPLF